MQSKVIDVGSRRELFVDYHLVEKCKKTFMQQQQPQPEEVVLRHDPPWEGPVSLYHTVIQDGDRVLLYYRGSQAPKAPEVYCVAESGDGIHFTRPELQMHAWNGSYKNNIFLAGGSFAHTFAPFLDTNPSTPKAARFKAFSRYMIPQGKDKKSNPVLYGFVSADGINWQKVSDQPIITDGAFDSQNVGFWSEAEKQYVAFYRTFASKEHFKSGAKGGTTRAKNLRCIARATSRDFLNWEPGTLMDYQTAGKPAPAEEFYINQTRPYFRAPHIYTAFPARFMNNRPALTEEEKQTIDLVSESQLNSCSDACFMTARAGNTWYDRTFMEAFVKPRPQPGHWSGRCNYPADGIVQTGPDEISFYVDEFYAQPGNQLRRYSLRLDGFSSIHAPHEGGEMITKPMTFSGSALELNYATSAAGSLRVEIRDKDNRPIPGYTLREAVDIFGNRIAGHASWHHGTDVSKLAGQPIRLRFVMRDADLFSMRFVA